MSIVLAMRGGYRVPGPHTRVSRDVDLDKLKKEIQEGTYEVPAELVAEAILPWIVSPKDLDEGLAAGGARRRPRPSGSS